MPRVKLTQARRRRNQAADRQDQRDALGYPVSGFRAEGFSQGPANLDRHVPGDGKAVMETLPPWPSSPMLPRQGPSPGRRWSRPGRASNPVEERREEEAAAAAAAKAEKKTFAWLIEHTEQGKHGEVAGAISRNTPSAISAPATQYETRRTLKRAMPYLGDKLIAEIKRPISPSCSMTSLPSGKRRTRKDGQGGPNGEARAIHATLSTVFNWAVEEGHIEISPMATLSKSRHGKTQARERTLDVEEIKAFWAACDQIGWPFGPIGKLLLLTGQRAGEVVGMRLEEIAG